MNAADRSRREDALHARLEEAAAHRERVAEWVRAGERRAYLKGGPLAPRAASRHGLRELCLRVRPPRLAEAANLHWLRAHGFRAPLPLAAEVRRDRIGRPRWQALATAEVIGARTLDVALAEASPAARAPLLNELGRIVGRLHALGFVHRDLFPRNLLVRPAAADGAADRTVAEPPEVWLLDCWRGGRRAQSRGPAWDTACLLAEGATLFGEEGLAIYLRAYRDAANLAPGALARHLSSAADARARLLRRRPREAGPSTPATFEAAVWIQRLRP